MRVSLKSCSRLGLELGFSLALLVSPFGSLLLAEQGPADLELRFTAAVLMLFGAALGILVRVRSGHEPGWLRRPATALLATFFLIAAFWTPLFYESTERLLLWAAAALGGLALAQIDSARALRILLVLGLLVCCQALADRLYRIEDLRELARVQFKMDGIPDEFELFLASTRARVTFGQANGLAAFLTLLLPLALWRSISAGARRRPALILTCAVLAALWASGSRGGTLAAFSAVVLAFAFLPGRMQTWGRAGVGAVALAWLCVLAVYLLGSSTFDPEGPLKTLLLRRDYAVSALELSSPRGVGLELFGEAQQEDAPRAFSRYPHQAILGFVVELGFLALLPICALALILRQLWRRRELEAEEPQQGSPDSGGALVATYVVLVVAVFVGTIGFFSSIHPIQAAFVLGLAFLIDRFVARPLVTPGISSADRWCLAAGALGVFLHAQIDFDLRIFSLTTALSLVVALALAGPKVGKQAPASWRSAVLIFAILAVVAALQFHPLPGLAAIRSGLDSEKPEVRAAARERLEELPAAMRELPGLKRLAERAKEPR